MSNYLNFYINDEDGIKNWVMEELGYPLVHVEITDSQLTHCINDAIEEFTKYVIQEREYLALNLEDYNTSGFTLPDNVAGVFALEESMTFGGNAGVNVLFSTMNTMWNAGMLPIPWTGNRGSWIDYELAMSYVDLTKRMTASKFYFEYNERNKLLTLTPNPSKYGTEDGTGMKGYICIGCNVIRPDDQQYGESWVKRYALAKAKEIIGRIHSRYQGTQLLGGGLIDQSMKTEGQQEKAALLAELKSTYRFVNWFIG